MSAVFGVLALAALLWLGVRFGAAMARAERVIDRGIGLVRRPEGVRIVHADGQVTPCEPAFVGIDSEGFAVWDIMTPFDAAAGDRLHVAMMPGRSSLVIPKPVRHD